MKKHYHVLGGVHGCMPDVNLICETKHQARSVIVEEANQLRDYGYRYVGNCKDGYYEEISSMSCGHPNNYLEITECYQKECLEDIN